MNDAMVTGGGGQTDSKRVTPGRRRVWSMALGWAVLHLACSMPSAPPGGVANDNVAVTNDNASTEPNENAPGIVIDSDRDGFSDEAETGGRPATDPNDRADTPDNVRDSDDDGCSNFEEENFVGFCDGNPNSAPDDDPGSDDPLTIQVTGTLQVGQTLALDGDTLDPTNGSFDNGGQTSVNIQAIPNPCTLGGFLGLTGGGRDVSDFYRVQLAANQNASVLVANPTFNDFDLFLFEEAGMPVDSSEGIGEAEAVTAPSNGTYVIEVFGFSVDQEGDPGGLYTLLVGENALIAVPHDLARQRLSSLGAFVEGEAIVKRVAARAPVAKAVAPPVAARRVPTPAGSRTMNDPDRAGAFERVGFDLPPVAQAKTATPGRTSFRRPHSPTIAAIKALRRQADVVTAEPNYYRRPMATPNDELFALQWHYAQIHLPQAWDITTGSSDVVVAVIDTGVALAHPDLQGQLVGGFDFISDPANARDGDGIDSNPDDPGDLVLQGRQSSFHGTHVAGTIAARTNNATGVAGVAWDARLMPLRVLGQMGGTDFDIVQAIRFAAGLPNDSGTVPAQRADIINMSLGGAGFSAVEQQAITEARQAGVIIIAASGNESSNADFFTPAGLDGVVTVAAVDFGRNIASYSNFGSSVDVAAPGGDLTADLNGDTFGDGVLSTIARDDGSFTFELSQGTSMACPHVAGVAALMKTVNPDMTPLDFDRLLAGEHPGTTLSIVDDLGTTGRDNFSGFGLINAAAAVRAAGAAAGVSASNTPFLQVRPSDLGLGPELTSAPITVTNGGGGTLMVSTVTASADWLSVSPQTGGEGAYTVTITRAGLVDGVYSGTVAFASNGGSAEVAVRINVGAPVAEGGDIGSVYLLLIDPVTGESLDQYSTNAAANYEFTFADVPPGEYVLFAGTDLDNDSFIDNRGEAVGAYPTILDPVPVDATHDRVGLSFGVSYALNLQIPQSATVTSDSRIENGATTGVSSKRRGASVRRLDR